ncbi:MAG: TIGR04086 family membrane protein [Acidimicrobiales bacterium]
MSIIAGTLAAYGAFALIAAIAGAVLSAADEDTKFATNDWTSAGAVGAMATAFALFLAYLFGGYVAGRMARRAGVLHGVAVFVLGLLAAAAIGGVVAGVTDSADVERNLRSIGVPTTAEQWGDVGAVTAIAAVVLMAIGAILGGLMGERWHTKLARRALDPDYGPEAEERRRAADDRARVEREDRDRIERERESNRRNTAEQTDDDRRTPSSSPTRARRHPLRRQRRRRCGRRRLRAAPVGPRVGPAQPPRRRAPSQPGRVGRDRPDAADASDATLSARPHNRPLVGPADQPLSRTDNARIDHLP